MKRLIVVSLVLIIVFGANAQKKYEIGNPNDANAAYLKDYLPLKEYINYEKYPNFKLGIGTTVNDYLNNTNYTKNITEENFTETVAGNAMKMSSCVNGNGDMDFSTVTKYVNTATTAGLSVYGHTLAWHSQQANGWLRTIIADKPLDKSMCNTTVSEVFASKDFTKEKSVGWTSDKTQFGYSITFDSTNGAKIHTTKKTPNFWDVQYVVMENIPVAKGATCKMTITVKGSGSGNIHSKLGDWSNDCPQQLIPFTTEWKDVVVEYNKCIGNSFLLLQNGDFVGDIYIKKIQFETTVDAYKAPDGTIQTSIKLTDQEKHDTLVFAMGKWIQGMMKATAGKVTAWDVVNEAISGGGDDGEGNYVLQHSQGYNGGTWDVGGTEFYWQDYLGDLDYVRTAVAHARKYFAEAGGNPDELKLFINDYNLESDWDDNKKLRSLINWINKWESDGVTRIDGIGTQMHVSCSMNDGVLNSRKQWIENSFRLMAATGKLVRISELDMGMQQDYSGSIKNAQITEVMHKRMADFYEWIIKKYLEIIPPAQQWGICQWCPVDSPANGGWRADEPVGIWSRDLYRKHAYAGFVRGLNGGEPASLEDILHDINPYRQGTVYDINGVKVGSSLESLPAGLYIIDGKKIIKR